MKKKFEYLCTYVGDSKCQVIIFILNIVVYFQGARIELWDDSYIENVPKAFLETGKIEFDNFPMVEIFLFIICQNCIIYVCKLAKISLGIRLSKMSNLAET